MEGMKQYLQEAINAIKDTTGSFYQNRISEGYKQLERTIVLLDNLLIKAASLKQEGQTLPLDENKMLASLTEAMKAMEAKDVILLSDIMEYEIKEMLEQSLNNLL